MDDLSGKKIKVDILTMGRLPEGLTGPLENVEITERYYNVLIASGVVVNVKKPVEVVVATNIAPQPDDNRSVNTSIPEEESVEETSTNVKEESNGEEFVEETSTNIEEEIIPEEEVTEEESNDEESVEETSTDIVPRKKKKKKRTIVTEENNEE